MKLIVGILGICMCVIGGALGVGSILYAIWAPHYTQLPSQLGLTGLIIMGVGLIPIYIADMWMR